MESTQLDKSQAIAAALLLLALAVGSAGCRAIKGTLNGDVSRQGTLNGDVFIVTEGGENVKLGLVEVRVLPYQETKSSIAQTKAQAERETANMQPRLEAVRKRVASAEGRFKAADAAEVAALTSDHELDSASTYEDTVAAIESHNKTLHSAESRAKAAKAEAASAWEALADLEARARHWNSGALYLERLPPPVASAKTDADGKFSVAIDRKARFALAAYATRRVFDKLENYCWIVSVSLDGRPSKRIFLSNDNLATSDSKDSLVHVIE